MPGEAASLAADLAGFLGQRRAKAAVSSRYWSDPAAFASDVLGASPAPYQAEILSALHSRRRVCVRGPHGLGKTALVAWAAMAFAASREARGVGWKVVATAGGWRQLEKYLWPEITRWSRGARWGAAGIIPWREGRELLTMSIKLPHGEAFAVASDRAELIEGAHADEILYLIDEGKAIPDPTWDAIEGAFSAGEAYVLATSTPGPPIGRFHAIHARRPGLEDWWPRHVTLEEAIGAGRVTREWAAARARQWGDGSSVYRTRVLGEFAEEADGVIPLSWIEAAVDRWQEWKDSGARPGAQTSIGVDVGGGEMGGDRTVLAVRHGDIVTQVDVFARGDQMETAGRVMRTLQAGAYAQVDAIGVGAGVVSRLRELKADARAFVAGARPQGKDTSGELEFVNRRAEAWWGMRERLDPGNGSAVCLPPDSVLPGDGDASLVGELAAPRWRTTSAGKVAIEEKAEIRKRLGRSTDLADAVVQAFVRDGGGPVSASAVRVGRGGGRGF